MNELDEMLADLDFNEAEGIDEKETSPKINITELDVVDVLHNILN